MQHAQIMSIIFSEAGLTVEEILRELDSKYIVYGASSVSPPDQNIITGEDVSGWSYDSSLPRCEIYGVVAIHLALGFRRKAFDFKFCDDVINSLHSVITFNDEVRPEIFWDVFNAFDQGEYFHSGDDQTVDPSEKYTTPMLDAAMAKYSNEFQRFT